MKLIIQPEDGIKPLVQAVRRAKKSIDIVIFRFDRSELEKALEAAVARGVSVRALIAHTNRGGEKSLRKLELKLLNAGVTVARTADDLPRYHGKMMMVDGALYVLGFNYTQLDLDSRSFGIVTREPRLVKEAASLFEADSTRQSYTPSNDNLVISPESSRELLSMFIKRAKKQLLIYDAKVSDRLMLRLLQARAKAGVEIRMFGKLTKDIPGVDARKMPDLRLHVRAMIRDGSSAFVGSQSLRKVELDGRREVGVIITNPVVAKTMQAVFEADWSQTQPKGADKDASDKDKDKGREKAMAAGGG
ncbi:MAG: phospholipase D-like domain-containing protein [Acidobacteria bacterium]|nr:phospholipase D-like domain-containing protein [Acidobacteriota bacterium]MCA1651301.1 phospholipase D-like domain-containing protein [Acidobacteriota bacterium]